FYGRSASVEPQVAVRLKRAAGNFQTIHRGAFDHRLAGGKRRAAREVDSFEPDHHVRDDSVKLKLLWRCCRGDVQRTEAQRLRKLDDRPIAAGGAENQRAVQLKIGPAAFDEGAGNSRDVQVMHEAVVDLDDDRRGRILNI